MQKKVIDNVNISSERPLLTPKELKEKYPVSKEVEDFVSESRDIIRNILHKRDHRLLVICGPCSIHNIDSAIEYAKKLKKLNDEIGDDIYLVMRVYFEKPRTTVGWKGLINDPNIDGSFDVEAGLTKARQLLIQIAELGLPVATEALDPITPQYLSELFSWSAIGARTTESQIHREMASGLSMPVGFKNGTEGTLGTAINAMKSAASPHCFIGTNQIGQVTLLQTKGNPDGHIILRGGKKPNFDSYSIAIAEKEIDSAKIKALLVIDCSHANSSKDHKLQGLVAKDVFKQIKEGNKSILGIMLESHLFSGNQASTLPVDQLKYGVSITDACIDWEETENLLRYSKNEIGDSLKARMEDR